VEVNAIDLYIKMERKVEAKDAKDVFQALFQSGAKPPQND